MNVQGSRGRAVGQGHAAAREHAVPAAPLTILKAPVVFKVDLRAEALRHGFLSAWAHVLEFSPSSS